MNPELVLQVATTAANVMGLLARNLELYLNEDMTDEEFERRLKSVQDRFADLHGAFEVNE